VLAPALAVAQSLEPRLYLPLPKGMSVINFTYGHTSGDLVLDAALPLSNSHARLDAGTFAFVRTFGLFGRSAQVQAIAPFATGEASATVAGRDTTRNLDGLVDPMLRLAVNLKGGPAAALPPGSSAVTTRSRRRSPRASPPATAVILTFSPSATSIRGAVE